MADINKILLDSGYSQQEINETTGGNPFEIDEHQAKLYAEHHDSEFLSAGAGVLSSLSLGTSNWVLTKLGLVDRETLDAIRKYNPASYAIGEIGTDIATVLGTGGLGLLAKGSAKAASKLGFKGLAKNLAREGVETSFKSAKYFPTAMVDSYATKAANEVGDWASKKLLGKGVANSALRLGVNAGLDGAAIGIRDAITDEALDARETTIGGFVERGLSYAADGGMAGLLFGGGFGAAGHLAKVVGGKALARGQKYLSSKSDPIKIKDELLGRKKAPEFGPDYVPDELIESGTVSVNSNTAKDIYDNEIPFLQGLFKQADADGKLDDLLDDGDFFINRVQGQIDKNSDDLVAYLKQATKDAGVERSGITKVEELTRQLEIVQTLEKQYHNAADVAEKSSLLRLRKSIVRELESSKVAGKLGDKETLTFNYLLGEKQKFNKKGFETGAGGVVLNDFNKRLGAMYDNFIGDGLVRADIDRAVYHDINKQIASGIEIKSALNKKGKSTETGYKDAALQLAKGVFRSGLGRGGVGFLLGGIETAAIGAISAPAGRYVRKVLYKEAILKNVDIAQASYDKLKLDSVKKFLNKNAPQINRAKGRLFKSTLAAYGSGDRAENYETLKTDIVDLLQNPDQLASNIATVAGPIGDVFPDLASGYNAKAGQSLMYLHSKLIPEVPYGDILGQTKKIPSDLELDKFDKYMRTTLDPGSVFETLSNGYISMEQVETLRTLYPEIHSDIVDSILGGIIDSKKPLNYNQKTVLSTLMGLPYETNMNPRNVQAFQQTIVNQPDSGLQNTHGGFRPHNFQVSGSKQSQTKTQQIEESR